MPAISASLGNLPGVVTDHSGNFYFSGGGTLHCVFKVTAGGVMTRVAGTGRQGYSGDDGLATNAQLNDPVGLALDAAGNLYIADTYNHRVRKVSPEGIITTIAGIGWPGYSGGDGGPATRAQVNTPTGVAVDAAGNLYISEVYSHGVRKVNPAGTITTAAGNGTAGYSGDGGPATNATLAFPAGIAVDAVGNLYIADANNARVRKVTPAGIITTVAGNGTPGYSGDTGLATNAQLNNPVGLALDAAGNLFIADPANLRVRKVTPAGIIITVAGGGSGGDGGPATSALLSGAVGVSVNPAAELFIVADRVRKVSSTGIITTVAGNETYNYSGDDGPATSAQLGLPKAVALDAVGNLYITDHYNHRVRKVSPGGIITTIAGGGTGGDGGPAVDAELVLPTAAAVDAAGNLYVTELTAACRVRKIIPAGAITTVAGDFSCRYGGDGGLATNAQLNFPLGIALDATGNLYVADSDNDRVRKVAPAGTITTVVGNGTRGYSGDAGMATNAQLNHPMGLALDAAGNLYIADSNNARVRKVTPAGIITTVAGNAIQAYSGDGGSATYASLTWPKGLAVDAAGNLYISDDERIRKVTPAGLIITIAGTGAAGYSGDGGLATTALMNDPEGLAVDPSGNVYIADTSNNAIRILRPLTATATAGTPQSTWLKTLFPIPLQVTVKDSAGNPVRGAQVRFSAPSDGAGAGCYLGPVMYPAPVGVTSCDVFTDSSGVAVVMAAANGIVGTYQITARVGVVVSGSYLQMGATSTSFSLTNLPTPSSVSNLAQGKSATQSSTLAGYSSAGPASAVDGNTNGDFFGNSVTATNFETSPWWQVDLGVSTTIGSVVVWNRTDCCGSRLADYWVFISDAPFSAGDTPATLQSRAGTWTSHQTTAPNPSTTVTAGTRGRYVRIQLSGTDSLSLSEVQISGNVAQGKPAYQSSTLPGYPGTVAFSALDGATDGNFFHNSVTSTNLETSPWWQVDLGASAAISSIVIWNRTDCCGPRLGDYWVFISDTPFSAFDTPATLQSRGSTWGRDLVSAPAPSTNIMADAQGRFVRVQLNGTDYLSLAEVQIFGSARLDGSATGQLTMSHIGDFSRGQPTAVYTLSVRNNGTTAIGGSVSVASVLPAGIAVTNMAGPGWVCAVNTVSCSRSDPLTAGGIYPPILLTVSVSAGAPAQVTPQTTLSGALGTVVTTDTTIIQAPFTDVASADSFLPAIDLLRQSGITTGCLSSPPMYCSTDYITEAQMAVFVVRSVLGSDNFAYTDTPYFTDAPPSHLYFKWIQKMQDLGVAQPCGSSLYCSETAVTRGKMALLIIRSRFGTLLPTNYPTIPYFTDVPATHPYFPWIQKMKQLGITSGCSPTTYCPDDPVTRGQMAVFLIRGEFNQLLPATAPVLVWASQGSASPGQTLSLTIAGQNTNFMTGVSLVNAGPGVSVSNVSVVNSMTLTAQFTIAAGATQGPRSITVTTGTEEATLPNWFGVQ